MLPHWLWAVLLVQACTAPQVSAPAGNVWSYVLTLRDGARLIEVQASLPPGPELELGVAPAAIPFVDDVRMPALGSAAALIAVDGRYRIPASDLPRTLQWNFRAKVAAEQLAMEGLADWRGNGFLGSLGAMLLHPEAGSAEAERGFTLSVNHAPGLSFASVIPTIAANTRPSDGVQTGSLHQGVLKDLPEQPACAFGAIAVRSGRGPAAIVVADLTMRSAASAEDLDQWVNDAAKAITGYFGAFPVANLLVTIVPQRGPMIGGGTARGLGGARIIVPVPSHFRSGHFRRDWVLFHEMIHLALPSLPTTQHWLEEGSATYLEPLLQARAGRVSEAAVWSDMLAEFEQGLAAADAGGLDDDASWGRTYYGGAIFCLLADVEIRSLTNNRRSLQDALRAITKSGRNITQFGTIEEVLTIGDEATGTKVLHELYERMRKRPEPTELASLWARLGVQRVGQGVVYDEAAPLAEVRRALVLGTK